MRILAVDTCLPACSAAVTDGEVVVASTSEAMVKGHQERLAAMVRELMQQAGLGFGDLDRIAVTVGPGSFTGLRVGVAFAKGLAAALGIPCVGVGTLEALAFERPGLVVAAVDARRGQVYMQVLQDGLAMTDPVALKVEDAARTISSFGAPSALIGSGARLLAGYFPSANVDYEALPDPIDVARLGQQSVQPARPVYLRAPDAVLPA